MKRRGDIYGYIDFLSNRHAQLEKWCKRPSLFLDPEGIFNGLFDDWSMHKIYAGSTDDKCLRAHEDILLLYDSLLRISGSFPDRHEPTSSTEEFIDGEDWKAIIALSRNIKLKLLNLNF